MIQFDVITIGSATRDVFLHPTEECVYIEKNKKFKTGVGLCFSLESKIDVPEIYFRTGGSAVNAAITFANQGLKVAALCKIGMDSRGDSMIRRLQEARISTELVIRDKKYFTAYSMILVAAKARTIFVHRGATEHLCCDEPIPYEKLQQAKWLYITNLGGKSAKIFLPLINFAHKSGIKIALNPGKAQLKLADALVPVLEKIDVLVLNQEEASYLAGVPFEKEGDIFKKLDRWVKGFVVMTKGPEGFTACDNKHLYSAGILKEPKYIDRTGAGDAFGSGVVAGIIKGLSLDDALQLGSANATAVLAEWGANHGLLGPGDDMYKFGKLSISKKICDE
ncbi:MAG: PfkB family carbohydrate kinase [Candidatus Spechtbacterales bacterium]